MSGERDLDTLLASMSASLHEGVYVFATLHERDVPVDARPRMMFREAEGVTLILLREAAIELGLEFEFPCRMITLNVHSSLDAVGFLARITTRLAAADMGVNPVSGFYHDHLFVPEKRAQDAMTLLNDLSQEAAQK